MKLLDIERCFISKLLQEKDLLLVSDQRIDKYYLNGENRNAFQYIMQVYSEVGEVPTERVFKRKFPNYKLERTSEGELGTDEGLLFWCKELRQKRKHNMFVDSLEEAGEKLEDLQTDEAIAAVRKSLMKIENELTLSDDIDVTKTAVERKERYKERKAKKGVMGIPTGIYHLDHILRGLEDKTLTIVVGQTSSGKALANGTPVLCENGFKPIEQLKVGDVVFGRDGKPYPVLGVYPQGKKQMYKISFDDGTFVLCCKDHWWCVKSSKDSVSKKGFRVMSTEVMASFALYNGRSYNLRIPVCGEVEFKKKSLPIDPYFLGLLLGDGCFTGCTPTFTNTEDDLISWVKHRKKPLSV